MSRQNLSQTQSSTVPSCPFNQLVARLLARLSAPVFVLAFGALVACSPSPDFHTLDGDSGSRSELHEQWLFVNYWAPWCKPCLEEIPELNHFAEAMQGKAKVYAVNFDQPTIEQQRQQAEQIGIAFPSFSADPSAWLGFERPASLPATVVFKPGGELQTIVYGPQTLDSLAALIGEQGPKVKSAQH